MAPSQRVMREWFADVVAAIEQEQKTGVSMHAMLSTCILLSCVYCGCSCGNWGRHAQQVFSLLLHLPCAVWRDLLAAGHVCQLQVR